jgi:hypothetical protein
MATFSSAMDLKNPAEIIAITDSWAESGFHTPRDKFFGSVLAEHGVYKIPEWACVFQDKALVIADFDTPFFEEVCALLDAKELNNPWIWKAKGTPQVLHHSTDIVPAISLAAIIALYPGKGRYQLRNETRRRAFLESVFPRYAREDNKRLLSALTDVALCEYGRGGDLDSGKHFRQYIEEKLL